MRRCSTPSTGRAVTSSGSGAVAALDASPSSPSERGLAPDPRRRQGHGRRRRGRRGCHTLQHSTPLSRRGVEPEGALCLLPRDEQQLRVLEGRAICCGPRLVTLLPTTYEPNAPPPPPPPPAAALPTRSARRRRRFAAAGAAEDDVARLARNAYAAHAVSKFAPTSASASQPTASHDVLPRLARVRGPPSAAAERRDGCERRAGRPPAERTSTRPANACGAHRRHAGRFRKVGGRNASRRRPPRRATPASGGRVVAACAPTARPTDSCSRSRSGGWLPTSRARPPDGRTPRCPLLVATELGGTSRAPVAVASPDDDALVVAAREQLRAVAVKAHAPHTRCAECQRRRWR